MSRVDLQNVKSGFTREWTQTMNMLELQLYLQNLTSRKITASEIAYALKVSKQNISQRIKNSSEITVSELASIREYFNVKIDDSAISNSILVPILGDVSAGMGHGITVYNETKTADYQISSKLAHDLDINPKSVDMIFTSGDSMLPTIEGGDSVLIDRTRKEIYDGRIYCVRVDGQLLIKRLQKIPPHTVIVISDNQKYKSFEVDFSKPQMEFDFEIIGEVRWWGRVAR
jgi:phage repressor protein C with HTH and peptisase S24 domain